MIRPNEQDKKCNACIEAAKAWRTNFVCGASMALDVDWTPNGMIPGTDSEIVRETKIPS